MKNMPAKRFIIIGRTNVGKTLFILNFAEFMGYSDITIKYKTGGGEISKNDSIINLKKNIVSSLPNTTRCLQVAGIDIPVLKGKKTIEFVDTTGLSSSIHFDQDVRDGMVQTLTQLKENNIIFHILDAPAISEEKKIDGIDMEIYRYGRKRGNYLLLINKMDLGTYNDGIEIISRELPGTKIFKISALHKTGFEEVKKHVSKLA